MQIIKTKTDYQFIPRAKFFLPLSGLVVLLAFLAPFIIPPNWGTSFRGGTSIVVRFEQQTTSEEVRAAFVDFGFDDAVVQTYGSGGGAGGASRYLVKTGEISTADCAIIDRIKTSLSEALVAQGAPATPQLDAASFPACADIRDTFSIRFAAVEGYTPPEAEEEGVVRDPGSGVTVTQLVRALEGLGLDAAVSFEERGTVRRFIIRPQQLQSKVNAMLTQTFPERYDPDLGLAEVVTVGPDVGAKFRNDGIVSILFALGLILLYIAIRFDIRYAPGAVAALAHDVLITFGALTVLQMEITLETVAALLAIVGYSLNDTIVTFDRIRENIASGSDEPMPRLVNRSINECLSRTLLTSVTTLIAVAFLITGTGVVADFSLTLIIGIVVGTYSSIFVASPIMLFVNRIVEHRKRRHAPTTKPVGEAGASS